MTGLDDGLVDLLVNDPATNRTDLVERMRQRAPLLDGAELGEAVDRVLLRARGLGAIAPFLGDPAVNEVMINGPGPVWIDRSGQLAETSVVLSGDEVEVLIERVLHPLGLRVDRASPFVDARLADGSRVNVVVAPLAVAGPIVTIRRFSTTPLPLDAFGSPPAVELLAQLVSERATIIVVGGTGSGKTTLLSALGSLLPGEERVVVIEDTMELQLTGRHVVRLEARPPNSEGIGEITVRTLIRNALRMRPDRIVIGEVRGGEAFDLLLALNTGHRGSLSTCHANSAVAGVRRLETLCLLGGVDLPLAAIRQQLASAIDVLVHLVRDGDGTRRIATVASVVGDEIPEVRPLWTSDRADG